MASQAEVIRQCLPYMRRYARAVSGDQHSGDAAVRACLQHLLGVPAGGDEAMDRKFLYRALHDVWQDPGAAPSGQPDAVPVVVARLDSLSPRRRQALLLTLLEGFSASDAGYIMRVADEAELAALLQEAKRELKAQEATRILIIEDEPVIALDIASIVEQSGHQVVGIATTRTEAVALAASEQPGLVLADIQLADDSSGIDAVNEILTAHRMPIVFITAFPDRLLTGDKPEPAFLITKPFDAETLSITVSQALSTRAAVASRAA
jgi:CheY-like chemotaxis protein